MLISAFFIFIFLVYFVFGIWGAVGTNKGIVIALSFSDHIMKNTHYPSGHYAYHQMDDECGGKDSPRPTCSLPSGSAVPSEGRRAVIGGPGRAWLRMLETQVA